MVMGESSRGAGAVNKFLLRSPLTVMSCHASHASEFVYDS